MWVVNIIKDAKHKSKNKRREVKDEGRANKNEQ